MENARTACYLGRLLEIEGHLALSSAEPSRAFACLLSARRQYLVQADQQAASDCQRAAAKLLERFEGLELPGQAVDLGAGIEFLETRLQARIIEGSAPREVAWGLCQLGQRCLAGEEYRRAMAYLLWGAILERLLRRPLHERAETLYTLGRLQAYFPDGSVERELAESGIPSWLEPIFGAYPSAIWHWLIDIVARESANRPPVEPEPVDASEPGASFQRWLDEAIGLTALVVRLWGRTKQEQREQWVQTLEMGAREIMAASWLQQPTDSLNCELSSLLQGLADLCRGVPVEVVFRAVDPPFNRVITQVSLLASQSIWSQPAYRSLDYLVEQAAQWSVETLRAQSWHPLRARHPADLLFHYTLLRDELQSHQELQPLVRYLEALGKLVASVGRQGADQVELEPTFALVLTEVHVAVNNLRNQDPT